MIKHSGLSATVLTLAIGNGKQYPKPLEAAIEFVSNVVKLSCGIHPSIRGMDDHVITFFLEEQDRYAKLKHYLRLSTRMTAYYDRTFPEGVGVKMVFYGNGRKSLVDLKVVFDNRGHLVHVSWSDNKEPGPL